MANVLDLRRRIRSVKNTRQITKAMKMVAAAKLRRAQERMTEARPYAVMLATVLASLRRRLDAVDPATNVARSPLLEVRPEKNILLVVISGDKGFAGAFSTNITRASMRFLAEQKQADGERRVDVEAVGRKGRDYFRRNYPTAELPERAHLDQAHLDTQGGSAGAGDQTGQTGSPEGSGTRTTRPADSGAGREAERESVPAERTRKGDVEFVADEQAGAIVLDRLRFDDVRAVGEEIVARYAEGEVDAVYLCYNQFRSVISQRVVVERVLPLIAGRASEIEAPKVAQSEEQSQEERQKAAEAALSAGLSLRDDEQEAIRAQHEDESKRFGTAEVDYLYDQPAPEVYRALLPRYVSALLYYAMLESVASEHAARMTAMDAATSNASDMIDALTLTMNRVRQAAITKEIIEIVSGASAV